MEKENLNQAIEDQAENSLGVVKIADDVVAMIAVLAALEVDGIVSPVGKKTQEWVNKFGYNTLAKVAKVKVYGKKVMVDIALTVEYGFNIPSTCSQVQTKIQTAIENMTGLEVTDVNVRINSVHVN
ncbi:MAG: Asp23/Gls24 family envelope stress response protein [Lachnospiraceae bacterium]|nr:Asp23/Gls24 family envelope stress response protein [Lachnospiraceae bacterium]